LTEGASTMADQPPKKKRKRGPKSKMRCEDYFVNEYQECPGCMTNRVKGNKKERCSYKPPPGAEGVPDRQVYLTT